MPFLGHAVEVTFQIVLEGQEALYWADLKKRSSAQVPERAKHQDTIIHGMFEDGQ